MTPRSDGLFVARANGDVDRFALANPHPEASLHTLFGKVWYEGYAGQSTCGSRPGPPTTSSQR